MALPSSIETERTLYLQKILRAESPDALINWPLPTKDDFALVGTLIVQYSYIDYRLRRFIEIFETANKLPAVWRGKAAKMPIGDVETILQAAPGWNANNLIAFERIRELRKTRNLMAHFAIKRFPTEDAFLFITKSATDFKRLFGRDPYPGEVMTGVVDVEQTRKAIKVIDGLLTWLTQATGQMEDQFLGRS